MKKVCAIIVTYNRRELLLRVIKSVLNQTYKLNAILVVDNASTDDTIVFLDVNGIIQAEEVKENQLSPMKDVEGVSMFYYRSTSNMGGAGGFHTGMREASALEKFDYLWMMDDDGYPAEDCLAFQMEISDKNDYVMPTSIDIDNHRQLSWATKMKNGSKTFFYDDLLKSWGEVMTYIYPFNGSLLSKKIVEEVGFINKDLFIWGDEYDHYWRCKKKGYTPVTYLKAQFYHPANKMNMVPILGGMVHVPYVDSPLKLICLIRNSTYIDWNYNHRLKIIPKFFIYSWFFIISRGFDYKGYKLYLQSVKDGLSKNFTRHLKYLR